MKLLKVEKPLKIITDLKFAIFILAIIALTSSLGSFIEQDEGINFYQENYEKPIYGFIDSNFICILFISELNLMHLIFSSNAEFYQANCYSPLFFR